MSHGYILPAGQVPGGSIRGNKFGYGQFGKGGKARTASDTVVKALRAGSRDGLTREEFRYVATVRERRFLDAARDYEEALRGKNPYASGRAWERAREQGIQKGRQWAQLEPLTKDDVKWAETNYRLELRRYLAPWSGKDFQLRARFPELFTLGPGRLPKKRVSSGAGVVSAVKGKTSGKKTTGSKTTGSKVGVKQKPGVPVLATVGAGGKPPRKPPVKGVGGVFDPGDNPKRSRYGKKYNVPPENGWKDVIDFSSVLPDEKLSNDMSIIEKVFYGIRDSEGNVIAGGHGFGIEVKKKSRHTAFRERWTIDDAREAYLYTLNHGHMYAKSGTRITMRARYKGEEFVLRYDLGIPHPPRSVKFYPRDER
ncbi:hypothetical protein [Actinotignum urinale]|uniref:hypothetical protein n=1 Tax=Actinotignum urinale TaxID=190146 RepID=UPI0003B772A3|nr:hypothetical protein [Actinotignum urinale]MDY5159504.1 hypothetical protein [Actinotignum urinale]